MDSAVIDGVHIIELQLFNAVTDEMGVGVQYCVYLVDHGFAFSNPMMSR